MTTNGNAAKINRAILARTPTPSEVYLSFEISTGDRCSLCLSAVTKADRLILERLMNLVCK